MAKKATKRKAAPKKKSAKRKAAPKRKAAKKKKNNSFLKKNPPTKSEVFCLIYHLIPRFCCSEYTINLSLQKNTHT